MANKDTTKWQSLRTRTISALLLFPMVLVIMYTGGIYFDLMVLGAGILMIHEWQSIIRRSPSCLWQLTGWIYVLSFCLAATYLRRIDMYLILWVCLVVWTTDIGAYFGGITLGGPKLLPSVSPKKTWSGFIIALISVALLCSALCKLLPRYSDNSWILGGVLISIISQLGDLFESWMKRQFSVKDSGNLIPGHGGILDRVDGLVPATVALTIVVFLT